MSCSSNKSCECEIHKGDKGTILQANLSDCGSPVLLEVSDSADFLFRKPDGQVIRRTGEIVSPPSSTIRYTTVEDDLDQAGRWQFQLAVSIAAQGWEGYTCKVPFDVIDVFEE
jgi:hypothetical protein